MKGMRRPCTGQTELVDWYRMCCSSAPGMPATQSKVICWHLPFIHYSRTRARMHGKFRNGLHASRQLEACRYCFVIACRGPFHPLQGKCIYLCNGVRISHLACCSVFWGNAGSVSHSQVASPQGACRRHALSCVSSLLVSIHIN